MSLFLSDSLPAASVVLPRIQAQLRDNQLRRQDLLGNTSVMPSKMRTLHNQDLLRRYPITLRGLKQVRECLRCKQIYTLCSALGQWQCKYHPGRMEMPMRRMSCCGEIQNGMGTRGCTPCDHSEFEDVPAGILFYQLDPPLADALDRPPLAEAFHRQVVPYPPPTRLTLGPVYNLVAAQDMPEDAQEQMQEQQELDEKAVLDAPRAQATPNGFYIGPCQLAVENSNSLGHVYQPSANQQQMTDVLYFQTASLQPTLAADGTRAIARQFAPFCLC